MRLTEIKNLTEILNIDAVCDKCQQIVNFPLLEANQVRNNLFEESKKIYELENYNHKCPGKMQNAEFRDLLVRLALEHNIKVIINYRALQKILINKGFDSSDDLSCTLVNQCFHIKPALKVEYNNEAFGLEEEMKATGRDGVRLYAIAKMNLGDDKVITYTEIDHYNLKGTVYDIYEIKTCDLMRVANSIQKFFDGVLRHEAKSSYPSNKSLRILIGENWSESYIKNPELVCLKNFLFRIDTIWLKIVWVINGKNESKGFTIKTENLMSCIEKSDKFAKHISPRLNCLKRLVNYLADNDKTSYKISISIENSNLKFNYTAVEFKS